MTERASTLIHVSGDVPHSTVKKIERDIDDFKKIKKIVDSMETYTDKAVRTHSIPKTPKVTSAQTTRATSGIKTIEDDTLPISRVQTSTMSLNRPRLSKSTLSRTRTTPRTNSMVTPPPADVVSRARSYISIQNDNHEGHDHEQELANPVVVVDEGVYHPSSNDYDRIMRVKLPPTCYTCGNDLAKHEPVVGYMVDKGVTNHNDMINMIVLLMLIMRSGPNADLLADADESLEGVWEYDNERLLRQFIDIVLRWKNDDKMTWEEINDKIMTDYGIEGRIMDQLMTRKLCCRWNIMAPSKFYIPADEQNIAKNELDNGTGIFDRVFPGLDYESTDKRPVARVRTDE